MNDKKEVAAQHREVVEWESQTELIRIELKTFTKQLVNIKSNNTAENAVKQSFDMEEKLEHLKEYTEQILSELATRSQVFAKTEEEATEKEDTMIEDHVALFRGCTNLFNLYEKFKTDFHRYLSI